MDDDDYRVLVAHVQGEFRRIGAPELGDDGSYLDEDRETGDARLLPPRERLLAMLGAFERYMAVRDRQTYRDAMARMREFVREPPAGAVVLPLPGAENTAAIDLEGAPELGDVRGTLQRLAERLAVADADAGA